MLYSGVVTLLGLAVITNPGSSSSKQGEGGSSESQTDTSSLTRSKKKFNLSALDQKDRYPEGSLLKASTFWKLIETLNSLVALYDLVKSLFHRH